MRILSWNINGLATTLQYHPWSETKSYKNLLDTLEADIICLQEIKTQRSKLTRDMGLVPGYDGYFSYSKTKPGYSGVAVYVKQPLRPLDTDECITTGLTPTFLDTLKTTDRELLNNEGRSMVMDFGQFVLFNIYFPNDSGETRMDFKMDYHHCVRQRIDQLLQQGRQVILAGDINAVHEPIDHCDPKQSMKERGITDFKDLPHRQWIDKLIAPKGPLVDTCRFSHPNRKAMFTCWNTRINARPANFGTRIDYVLISEGLLPWFKTADIRADILGSDHCPVYADFKDSLQDDNNVIDFIPNNTTIDTSSPFLAANYPEFKQKKLSTFFTQNKATTIGSPLPPSPASSTSSASSTSATSSLTTTTGTKRKSMNTGEQGNKRQQNLIKSYFEKKSDTPKDEMIDMEAIVSQMEARQEQNQVWTDLFQPPTVPRCRVHQAKCIEYTVNKKGPNQGRRFYLCSKPVGPQDGNSVDYRCDFFQWKHDKK
ncbi:Endonuclease/exonuclease/phosphatase [Halteromyces radiatus]|uniref:Endonuclease/exonuclease/phosphatase n=1 Tax=Halteromyces radiatus TaxID=101107 RepID=UPI00221E54D1|nr:Endonuclease/exonuclease/phosphatase [Halteromyces radiatus]KAI8089227.1 Endonuclease/exonuclease/phosphatase [Halteromyces radiatus]